MSEADFWKDPESAQKVQRRRKRIETDLEFLKKLKTQEDDTRVLVDWLAQGEDVQKDLKASLEGLQALIEEAELQKMLGGEHDAANAIVSINSGEGGTDSQDWAE